MLDIQSEDHLAVPDTDHFASQPNNPDDSDDDDLVLLYPYSESEPDDEAPPAAHASPEPLQTTPRVCWTIDVSAWNDGVVLDTRMTICVA